MKSNLPITDHFDVIESYKAKIENEIDNPVPTSNSHKLFFPSNLGWSFFRHVHNGTPSWSLAWQAEKQEVRSKLQIWEWKAHSHLWFLQETIKHSSKH